jgi:hypothetical protein
LQRRRYAARIALAALALATLASCVPATPVRRTAFVPRNSIASRSGGPLEGGEFAGELQINSVGLDEATRAARSPGEEVISKIPSVGDPGLYVPKMQIGATGYYGINRYLELGAQLHVTRLGWATPNYLGVLPFPEDTVDWMVIAGPGVRANLPAGDSPVTFSWHTELAFASIPQATYVCETCPGGAREGQGDGARPEYELRGVERHLTALPSMQFSTSVSIFEVIHPFAFVGAQRSIVNTGFDPDRDNVDNHTLEGVWLGQLGSGVEFRVHPMSVTLMFAKPIAAPRGLPLDYSLGVQMGVVLGGPGFTRRARPAPSSGETP